MGAGCITGVGCGAGVEEVGLKRGMEVVEIRAWAVYWRGECWRLRLRLRLRYGTGCEDVW